MFKTASFDNLSLDWSRLYASKIDLFPSLWVVSPRWVIDYDKWRRILMLGLFWLQQIKSE